MNTLPRNTLALTLTLLAPAVWADPAGSAQAANNFLASLEDSKQPAAAFTWSDPERRQWTYLPFGHTGLPLSEMSDAQRQAAMDLAATGLSEDGRERARQVMALEHEEAGKGLLSWLWTDGDAYYTSVFGDPGAERWSWRFEGHHLSVNLTHDGGQLVSATPYFIGADPSIVTDGPLAGLRILAAEETDARALYLSLDEGQRSRALVAEKAPRDILTGRDSRADLPCCEGITYGALNPNQQEELLALVMLLAGQLHPDAAELHLSRMREAGVDKLTFAWAGSSTPGEGHYYRIQGPTLLIEYDNTQNDASHIHLVLRDPVLDFGGDPLQAHYEAGHRTPR